MSLISRFNYYKFLAVSMAIMIVVLSGTIFVSIETGGFIRNIIYVLFYLWGLFFLLLKGNQLSLKRQVLNAIIVASILVLISCINCIRTAFDAIKMLLIFTVLMLYVEYCKAKRINYKLYIYKFILLLSAISIGFYILIEVLGIGFLYTVVVNGSTNYNNYCNLYFTENMFRYWIGGYELHRIQSFFTEPGIFAIYLNYAIYLHLYEKIENSRKCLIILALGLLLTLSTTGLCLGVAQISYYYYKSIKSKRSRIFVLVPTLAITGIIIIDIFMRKATMDPNINGSYYLRSTDIIYGLQVWLAHPLFGTGYINHDYFLTIQPLGRGCSNGIIQWLYTTGVVGMVAIISPFIKRIARNVNNPIIFQSKIILFALYFISGMTEPIVITPFMMLIVADVVCESIRSET